MTLRDHLMIMNLTFMIIAAIKDSMLLGIVSTVGAFMALMYKIDEQGKEKL